MKNLYRIYLDLDDKTRCYIKFLLLGGEPPVQIVPVWEKEKATIYEEDEAIIYMSLLVKQFVCIDDLVFGMELVEKGE